MPGLPAPERLSEEDTQLILAMELLRQQFATSAAQTAANTRRSAADYERQAVAMREFFAGRGGLVSPTAAPGAPAGTPPPAPKPKANADEEHGMTRPGPERAAPTPSPAATGGVPAAPGAGASNPILEVLSQVAREFTAITGPAAALSQVFGSTLSGFQVLQNAVQVFATTLAPLLSPAVLLVATAFTAAASAIEGGLKGALGQFFALVRLGMPIIVGFIDVLQLATNGLQQLDAERARKAVGGTSAVEDLVANGFGNVRPAFPSGFGLTAPIGQFGSIGQQVRTAAPNGDPVAAQMLQVQRDTLAEIRSAFAQFRRGQQPSRVYDPDAGNTGGRDYGGGS